MSGALFDQILAIDLATLVDPVTGGPLDPVAYRAVLLDGFGATDYVTVRRRGLVLAYAALRTPTPNTIFVSGLGLRPNHAGPGAIRGLARAVLAVLATRPGNVIESHVRRGNAASLALHRRLGFEIAAENDRAIAFAAPSTRIIARLTRFCAS